jgi:ribonuclease M5
MEIRKLNIPYPIVVEGKYDRLRVLSVCNAKVMTTEGFGIFKKKEKLALLREISRKTPVIVLTDSDGAGRLIRSHITSAIPKDKLIQLYIPKIKGTEKRKSQPSAEGTLGVEGMERELLYGILAPYENEDALASVAENPLSKTDFYMDGLSGGEGSRMARAALAKHFSLPEDMTANALLEALNLLSTYEEYKSAVASLAPDA